MKKIMSLLIITFMMFTDIFAQYPSDGFEITSGIDTSKQSEATFDSSRTISGTAEKGTVVKIEIDNGEDTQDCSIEVGSSRYFSFSADLEEGCNDILITAKMPDGSFSEIKTAVNRKGSEIKSQLESNIALPGESLERG